MRNMLKIDEALTVQFIFGTAGATIPYYVYNPSNWLFATGNMTDAGGGAYTLVFTPDVEGIWTVKATSVTLGKEFFCYLDVGTPTDLEILQDVARVGYMGTHSRVRVYPREPSETLRLTASALADTWGDWTALIPINTVTMDYFIGGILIESWKATDTYMIQLATSATPTAEQYIGEIRINAPLADEWVSTIPVIVKTGKVASNGGVWGRVKVAGTNTNWIDISLCIQKWVILLEEVPLEAAFPW